MDSPREYLSRLQNVTDSQMHLITACFEEIKNPIHTLSTTRQHAAYVYEKVCQIAETLTNGLDYNFVEMVGHMMAKLKIVHYNRPVCDCVDFKSNSDSEKVSKRINKIMEQIQKGG